MILYIFSSYNSYFDIKSKSNIFDLYASVSNSQCAVKITIILFQSFSLICFATSNPEESSTSISSMYILFSYVW